MLSDRALRFLEFIFVVVAAVLIILVVAYMVAVAFEVGVPVDPVPPVCTVGMWV